MESIKYTLNKVKFTIFDNGSVNLMMLNNLWKDFTLDNEQMEKLIKEYNTTKRMWFKK